MLKCILYSDDRFIWTKITAYFCRFRKWEHKKVCKSAKKGGCTLNGAYALKWNFTMYLLAYRRHDTANAQLSNSESEVSHLNNPLCKVHYKKNWSNKSTITNLTKSREIVGHSSFVRIFHFSEDNKVMFWDIRSAKGSLMVLDQHNGDTTGSPQSGEYM